LIKNWDTNNDEKLAFSNLLEMILPKNNS